MNHYDTDLTAAPADGELWAAFLLGLEVGCESGYGQGYADADQNLREALREFFTAHPIASTLRDIETDAARQAARARQTDARTGAQLVGDATASWGLRGPRGHADIPA